MGCGGLKIIKIMRVLKKGNEYMHAFPTLTFPSFNFFSSSSLYLSPPDPIGGPSQLHILAQASHRRFTSSPPLFVPAMG